VKVKSTSLNPVDSWIRRGYGKDLFETQRKLPIIPGRDFSGSVVGVGSNVWNFKVGDDVFAATWPLDEGCHAEYVAVHEGYVSLKPKTLSHKESSSLPYVGLTAYRALIDIAQMKRGQSILILGGAGGVGTFALQLSKHFGCFVTVTSNNKHHQKLTSLGADCVVESDIDHAGSFAIILDCVGGTRRTEAFTKLNRGGHLVTLLGDLIRLTDERGVIPGLTSASVQLLSEKLVQKAGLGVDYDWALFRPSGMKLEEIAKLVDSKAIKPVVDNSQFHFDQIIEAYEHFESGTASGKVTIQNE